MCGVGKFKSESLRNGSCPCSKHTLANLMGQEETSAKMFTAEVGSPVIAPEKNTDNLSYLTTAAAAAAAAAALFQLLHVR